MSYMIDLQVKMLRSSILLHGVRIYFEKGVAYYMQSLWIPTATSSLVSTNMTIIIGSVTYCDIHSRSISMVMPMDLILGGGG